VPLHVPISVVFLKGPEGKLASNSLQVQLGEDPDDWKPIEAVGPGVREIRIREVSGIYRVMYVAKFADSIYVLHCFQKKTQKTPYHEIEIALQRLEHYIRRKRR